MCDGKLSWTYQQVAQRNESTTNGRACFEVFLDNMAVQVDVLSTLVKSRILGDLSGRLTNTVEDDLIYGMNT